MNSSAENKSEIYGNAVLCHTSVMENNQICADTFVELCRSLKKIRDEKFYLELNYETFEDYCENLAGIDVHQAYAYISLYEKLFVGGTQPAAKLFYRVKWSDFHRLI